MNESYFSGLGVYLIDTAASLYIFALMLRFLLQWVEADFYNPISKFLVKITHPPLKPLRRFIPPLGRIDTASLVLMLILQASAVYAISLLQFFRISPAGLLFLSIGQLLELLYNIYFYSILISVALSWFAPRGYNPAVEILYALTEPVLRIFRSIIPPMGGLDVSPLLALVGLQFAKMAIQPPLQQLVAMLN